MGSKVTPSPNHHVEFSFRWSGNCLDKLPVTFRAFALVVRANQGIESYVCLKLLHFDLFGVPTR